MAKLADQLSVALASTATPSRSEDAPPVSDLFALAKWLEDGAATSSAFLDSVSKGKYASLGLHAQATFALP